MEQILNRFTKDKLFDATSALLSKLNIEFDRETAEPISVADLYDTVMPKYLTEALECIEATYFVGIVNDGSLRGVKASESLSSVADTVQHGGKYDGMFIFACDAKPDAALTRTAASALTRAFNRIASANPVILIIRQGNLLSLATCERMEYSQTWRQGGGEKLGKVSILRNINCGHVHAGHLQILEQLASDRFDTFEKLYKHWMKVFNSELLTKKFYNDLFEWYQWAVAPETKVSFPGNADTQSDDREDIDTRVIRLITRLMFVWFIKQKGLVPECIFNEEHLKNILKDFNPQSERDTNYYQAILQNLFFGTLNRAIIEDGEKREFAKASRSDVKNLYRYEELFSISEQEVVELFSTVPFLNCGLFECQDKTKMLDGVARRYYNDGFSRNAAKFADGTYRYRAVVPNVLFFHPTKGILSIFNRYVFTIEENTPQDVQVALDPELLGKVFENLLGAYNPETKETARNQSGSFYTPREIVQYMVNESLVAHLKRTVGEHLESQYRQLLDFTTEAVDLAESEKKAILHSLFTCKVLDPACGSGAFPMGMLQQMVHILQQVDPDNSQWRDVLLNMAVDESRRAFGIVDEAERKKKLLEIEETFNNGLNSPDYTRKLYIIESCIYGVDIQPIAMLITRLRFFITLICEQNDIKRDKPEENFGIKTLPNLESKFVAANSLIDADIHKYNEDWTQNETLGLLKDELMAIRRRHFYTRKRNEKMRLLREDEKKREQIHTLINKLVGEPNRKHIAQLEQQIKDNEALLPQYQGEKWVDETVQTDLFSEAEIIRVDKNKAIRTQLTNTINNCKKEIERELNKCTPQGFEAAVLQVTDWNPYDQNTVSPFLDIEWMFGVVDGFDIVIGNPPYIQLQADKGKLAKLYENCGFETFVKTGDIYCLFYERGWQLLKDNGYLCYITSNKWERAGYGELLREYFTSHTQPIIFIDFSETHVFDSACVMTNILLYQKEQYNDKFICVIVGDNDASEAKQLGNYVSKHSIISNFEKKESWVVRTDIQKRIRNKIISLGKRLSEWDIIVNRGVLTGYDKAFVIDSHTKQSLLNSCVDSKERETIQKIIVPILRGKDIRKFGFHWSDKWLINTHNGVKGQYGRIDVCTLPTLKKHLDGFWKKISKRTDKGDTPYNLRNCAYIDDFSKVKIIYPNMTKYMPFVYDENGYFTNPKCYIATGSHLAYLVSFFNSSLFKYCFRDDFPVLFGGARELQKVYFDQIPVLEVDDATDAEFRELVLDIQKEYSDEKAKAIDQKIFDLYGLTQEERDMIGYIDYHNNNAEDNDE